MTDDAIHKAYLKGWEDCIAHGKAIAESWFANWQSCKHIWVDCDEQGDGKCCYRCGVVLGQPVLEKDTYSAGAQQG